MTPSIVNDGVLNVLNGDSRLIYTKNTGSLHTDIQTGIQSDRQTDRHRDRQTDRETPRIVNDGVLNVLNGDSRLIYTQNTGSLHTDIQRDIQSHRQTQGQTDRQTDTETDRQTERLHA